jgi:hypothetical protein
MAGVMKAHAGDYRVDEFSDHRAKGEWRASWANMEPARDRLRRCWFCGSVHPEDLLAALRSGAQLEGADWKYGWPHKFYVRGIPNELRGQVVKVGSRCGLLRDRDGKLNVEDPTEAELARGRYDRPIMGNAPADAVVKFYTEHLVDAGEALDDLRAEILRQTRIDFVVEGESIKYRRLSPKEQTEVINAQPSSR